MVSLTDTFLSLILVLVLLNVRYTLHTHTIITGGAPLGYFDWAMIGQLLANGAESAAMFGATAFAMDYCMEKGYISKFPG
jgi:hypothetical protein